MLRLLVVLLCLAVPGVASARRWVAPDGDAAAGYNQRSGTAWKSEKNQNGVTTTETSRGGKAKTKNGMGVYEAPDGTKCVKGKNKEGCQ